MEQLAELLTADVTVLSDGGGKATAALRPVKGREAVLRLLQGLARTGLKGGNRLEYASLNGQDSLVVRDETGVVQTAMLFEIGEGAIQQIYFVRNPEKLANL